MGHRQFIPPPRSLMDVWAAARRRPLRIAALRMSTHMSQRRDLRAGFLGSGISVRLTAEGSSTLASGGGGHASPRSHRQRRRVPVAPPSRQRLLSSGFSTSMLEFWKRIKRSVGEWGAENIPGQGNGTWRIRDTRRRPRESGRRVSLLGLVAVEAGRAGHDLKTWAQAGHGGLVCQSPRQ